MSAKPLLIAVLVLCMLTAAPADEQVQVVEKQDGRFLHLSLKENPKAQGWLYEIWDKEDAAEEQPTELIVALHGAGGDPRNFILPRLMFDRSAYCLSVAGSREVPHATGRGFGWNSSDTDHVIALTRHVIKARKVDPKRVLVWGHSAGGAITLFVLARAPELFAGALTSAAGMAPTKKHETERVFVILGEDDPNYRAAPLVRKHMAQTKKTAGACALLSIEWHEHVLPASDFLDLGFDWVFHGTGRGGEARVGLIAKGRSGPWRHILLRHTDAKDKTDDVKRSKQEAAKLLEDVRTAVAAGTAFFPFEAARHSDDARSKSAGGGLGETRLTSFLGKLPVLKPGTCSKVLESSQGVHLVLREVEDE